MKGLIVGKMRGLWSWATPTRPFPLIMSQSPSVLSRRGILEDCQSQRLHVPGAGNSETGTFSCEEDHNVDFKVDPEWIKYYVAGSEDHHHNHHNHSLPPSGSRCKCTHHPPQEWWSDKRVMRTLWTALIAASVLLFVAVGTLLWWTQVRPAALPSSPVEMLRNGSRNEFPSRPVGHDPQDLRRSGIKQRKIPPRDPNSAHYLKEISRESWQLLNRNAAAAVSPPGVVDSRGAGRNGEVTVLVEDARVDGGGGIDGALPPVMLYTSGGLAVRNVTNTTMTTAGQASGDSSRNLVMSKRSCCRTQKYIQTVRVEGCEPVSLVNRMCSGQCMSVWIPGLFASFPACQPSSSHWKTLSLSCGPLRERKRVVRIEKIRRCSCMEPTNNNNNNNNESP